MDVNPRTDDDIIREFTDRQKTKKQAKTTKKVNGHPHEPQANIDGAALLNDVRAFVRGSWHFPPVTMPIR